MLVKIHLLGSFLSTPLIFFNFSRLIPVPLLDLLLGFKINYLSGEFILLQLMHLLDKVSLPLSGLDPLLNLWLILLQLDKSCLKCILLVLPQSELIPSLTKLCLEATVGTSRRHTRHKSSRLLLNGLSIPLRMSSSLCSCHKRVLFDPLGFNGHLGRTSITSLLFRLVETLSHVHHGSRL